MSPRHFFLFFLVCLVWGVNFVVAKWSVSGQPAIVPGFEGSPPFFFAFLRHLGLYACLAPWLLPIPRPLGPVIALTDPCSTCKEKFRKAGSCRAG